VTFTTLSIGTSTYSPTRGDFDALRRRATVGDLGAVRRWSDMITGRGDIDTLRSQVGSSAERRQDRTSN
jgi:hypothetical protein